VPSTAEANISPFRRAPDRRLVDYHKVEAVTHPGGEFDDPRDASQRRPITLDVRQGEKIRIVCRHGFNSTCHLGCGSARAQSFVTNEK
jgi:hypothetical protein